MRRQCSSQLDFVLASKRPLLEQVRNQLMSSVVSRVPKCTYECNRLWHSPVSYCVVLKTLNYFSKRSRKLSALVYNPQTVITGITQLKLEETSDAS